MNWVAGIDLGGSSVKAAAVGVSGSILTRTQAAFDPATPMAWAECAKALLHELQARMPQPPQAVGVSAPGLASPSGCCIAHMPGRLSGLEGFDWTTWLDQPAKVPVLNDAHAALLGEVWVGAARGLQNVFLLTLGTGVGGAAMVDGHLLRGHIGRAGHLGHICLDLDGPPDICGTPGSLEWLAGNATIRERSGGRFETTHALVAAFRQGDPEAERIWMRSIRALACGIASLINVLDPEAVVIGGGIAQAGEALFDPLQRCLDEVEWRPTGNAVRLLAASLGEHAGACGAAWQALRESQA